MIIITTAATEQEIKIIPRKLISIIHFHLVDKEQSANNINAIITASVNNEFMTIPFTASFLKEGRKYFITVHEKIGNSEARIWQGEALCTNQTDIQNYNING